MDFMSVDELIEQFLTRGHNFVMVYADSTQPNTPDNLAVVYMGEGQAGENSPLEANGTWQLFGLAEAFVHLYDSLRATGPIDVDERVAKRLKTIYNASEALAGRRPQPFYEDTLETPDRG